MKNKKRVLVLYVDVGSLQPAKAEAFIDRCVDKLKKQIGSEYTVVGLPVRPNSQTRIEVLP